ncbi:MAG: hypothetical protein L0H93_18145 [Nocardioides sp.]|nr:hypothetical protein [Nocardioides sp.]
MRRRRFLHLPAIATLALFTAACGPPHLEDVSEDGDMILSEAGFSPPDLEMQVIEGPSEVTSEWSHVVIFSGPATEVEAWVEANFPNGIESRAYKDNMQIAVDQVGEGVQKKGDRLASGAHGPVVFVVVVGQESEPTVHVAVRSTVR